MTIHEYDDEYTGERRWKAHLPFTIEFSVEYFEDLADAYEAGELGGFRLTIPRKAWEELDINLRERLTAIVGPGE